MDVPTKQRLSIGDRFVWILGSFAAFQQTGGFRRRREERFIRRLVAEYPVLADRPSSEMNAVASKVLWSLGVWRIYLSTLAAAVAAAFMMTPVLIAIGMFGYRVPNGAKVLIIFAAAAAVFELTRRWFITRQMDAAVAAVHPTLFCACGYCRVGLPDRSRCPECGAEGAEEAAATTASGRSAA